jgi:Cys-rich protein (TIGR01571 family)
MSNSFCPSCICCGYQKKEDKIEDSVLCCNIYHDRENIFEIKNKWINKLCQCDNCLDFFLSVFCFYFIHFEHYTFSKYNILDTCIFPCVLTEILCDIITFPLCCGTKTTIFLTRQFLKKKYNIESNICCDLLCSCFCPCLIVYQHDDEIRNNYSRVVIQVK